MKIIIINVPLIRHTVHLPSVPLHTQHGEKVTTTWSETKQDEAESLNEEKITICIIESIPHIFHVCYTLLQQKVQHTGKARRKGRTNWAGAEREEIAPVWDAVLLIFKYNLFPLHNRTALGSQKMWAHSIAQHGTAPQRHTYARNSRKHSHSLARTHIASLCVLSIAYHAHTKHMQRLEWREVFSFCFRSRSIPLFLWNSQQNSCSATAAAVALTHGIVIEHIKRSFRVLIEKNSFSKRRRTMGPKLKSWLLAKSPFFARRIHKDILKYTYTHIQPRSEFNQLSFRFYLFFHSTYQTIHRNRVPTRFQNNSWSCCLLFPSE